MHLVLGTDDVIRPAPISVDPDGVVDAAYFAEMGLARVTELAALASAGTPPSVQENQSPLLPVGIHRNLVARLEVGDVAAHLHDRTGEFVAHSESLVWVAREFTLHQRIITRTN